MKVLVWSLATVLTSVLAQEKQVGAWSRIQMIEEKHATLMDREDWVDPEEWMSLEIKTPKDKQAIAPKNNDRRLFQEPLAFDGCIPADGVPDYDFACFAGDDDDTSPTPEQPSFVRFFCTGTDQSIVTDDNCDCNVVLGGLQDETTDDWVGCNCTVLSNSVLDADTPTDGLSPPFDFTCDPCFREFKAISLDPDVNRTFEQVQATTTETQGCKDNSTFTPCYSAADPAALAAWEVACGNAGGNFLALQQYGTCSAGFNRVYTASRTSYRCAGKSCDIDELKASIISDFRTDVRSQDGVSNCAFSVNDSVDGPSNSSGGAVFNLNGVIWIFVVCNSSLLWYYNN